jgi:hypothetical protein
MIIDPLRRSRNRQMHPRTAQGHVRNHLNARHL